MTINKYKFVSPGVFFDEIDNSQLPSTAGDNIGPVVIGRSKKGPSGKPVRVDSFSEFVEMFGEPVAGTRGGDVWRDGNDTAPTYGPYAAQAWLRNNAPLTFVRLLGEQSSNAETAGKAGWETEANTLSTDLSTNGGAFGLFVSDDTSANVSGALAAVFYLNEGGMALSGSDRDGTQTSGSAKFIKSTGADKEFKAIIYDSSGNEVENKSFNFNEASDRYIRKVFNTNPIKTNSDIITAENLKTYWLGETFERHLDTYVTSSGAGNQVGAILGLDSVATGDRSGASYRFANQPAETGWFFSQDTSDNTGSFDPRDLQKLFKFHALDGGEWDSKNLKISIRDIVESPSSDVGYGTFTVVLRKASDSDQNPQIVEQFSNVNLNPDSSDYIAAKIGDRYMKWDDDKKLYREYGIYENRSRYVRIEMNPDVQDGLISPALLPFGCFGPLQHRGFKLIQGESATKKITDATADFTASFARGQGSIPRSGAGSEFVDAGTSAISASIYFPEIPLRNKATDLPLSDPKEAYFGIDTGKTATSTQFDPGYVDLVRTLSGDYKDEAENELVTYEWIFTLDDVSGSSVVNDLTAPAEYVSGSRKSGTSISAVSSDGWKKVLEAGHNKFTVPLDGGFDGLDITEKEPLRNSKINTNPTETNDHVYYTYKKAIDSIRDSEVVEHSLATIPGLTDEGLTGLLVRTCENRRDSLAIIDPDGGYTPRTENKQNQESRIGDTDSIASNMKSRGLNSSYGTAYDPWVQIRDPQNGSRVFVPPSVVALGTYGSNDRESALWFAPAGYNRGGLSDGVAGLDVVAVTRRLTKPERDKLYSANINPIASFPSDGIVVFGQKTLQTVPSATDRVNVRRMMNHVKKRVSQFANEILFDQNVRSTWNKFTSLANPFLKDIKSRFGLEEYRLILDESTTTPDVRDRNAVYGKVILKPAKAIEFIAVDFVITNSGAGFDD